MLSILEIDDKLFNISRNSRTAKMSTLFQKIVKEFEKDTLQIVNHGVPHDLNKNSLDDFFKKIDTLPDSIQKKEIIKYLRIWLQIIKDYLLDTHPNKVEIEQSLLEISKNIGLVPELNPTISLPASQFLPTNYAEKTWTKWSKLKWTAPSRTSKGEKLSFMVKKGDGTSSVRAHLLDEDKSIEEGKGCHLDYSECDFLLDGNLQADHLQPSTEIVARQKELILAMNYNPKFKQKMMGTGASATTTQGYFIEIEEEIDTENISESAVGSASKTEVQTRTVTYGTKKFYMEYHNCIDNLWLISATANTGAGKGAGDVISWLEKSEYFGDHFFSSLGGKAKVQTNTILYTVQPTGDLLAKCAKKWVLEYHKPSIEASSLTELQIKRPLLEEALKISEARFLNQPWKHKKIKQNKRLGLAQAATTLDFSDDSKGSASIDTEEADDPEATAKFAAGFAEHSAELKALGSMVGSEVSQRKAQKRGLRLFEGATAAAASQNEQTRDHDPKSGDESDSSSSEEEVRSPQAKIPRTTKQ